MSGKSEIKIHDLDISIDSYSKDEGGQERHEVALIA
jgi:hypothetical protein